MEQTYEQVKEKYGKTHNIRKWSGVKVDLTELAANQSICYGDGVNYHWLLTEKLVKQPNLLIVMPIRLLAFPFFAILMMIVVFISFLKSLGSFLMYGGECIAYTAKTRPVMIHDVFLKVQELINKK